MADWNIYLHSDIWENGVTMGKYVWYLWEIVCCVVPVKIVFSLSSAYEKGSNKSKQAQL